MPISTPEQRQKACNYCSTPADLMAVTCENCGSALPIALPESIPRPVARLVEAQSRWSMKKTALVSMVVSGLLGVFLQAGTGYAVLAGALTALWLLLALPVMLVTSAIMSARKNAGRIIMGLLASIGLWILAVVLVTILGVVVNIKTPDAALQGGAAAVNSGGGL